MRLKEGLGCGKFKKRGETNFQQILILGIIIALVLILGAVAYFVFFGKSSGGNNAGTTTTLLSGVKVGQSDTMSVQCKSACDSGSKVSFCDVQRKASATLTATCKELSANSQYPSYNVQACPAINCNSVQQNSSQADTTCISGLGGKWLTPTSNGKCPVSGNRILIKLTSSDSPPTAGEICCR